MTTTTNQFHQHDFPKVVFVVTITLFQSFFQVLVHQHDNPYLAPKFRRPGEHLLKG